ncbi:type IV toxin-antitoxin system AbiEi family antitoxin domain-containing protein [Luteimicrobium sp. DT211]|uniref:type IV toxin-antitoxin system AbiEi family antitoxin domain-containing protein n=1 Tax=Luteimicrobium sp. DT211 TaxID=3393412 RepID=UPI003CF6446D
MHRRTEVPRTLFALAQSQGGLASITQCREHGLTDKGVRGLVARRAWARPTSGVLDLRTPPPPETSVHDHARRRTAWLGLLAYGPDAISVGACALVLHGVEGTPVGLRAEAALPRASDRMSRDGIALRQFDDGLETVVIAGRRVASVAWALAQAVPELPRGQGLAVLDSALYRKKLGPAGLERAHDLARGRRGIATRHDLWELADARAESPFESTTRLECIEDGIPPDVLQLPLVDADGRELSRADAGWRKRDGRWLVAELDGSEIHDTPAAVFKDRTRQNLWVSTGVVDVLRFTPRDSGSIAPAICRALRG